VRHREFEMASGEMSEAEFTNFLERFIRCTVKFSHDGSIHYVFMDWRHLPELLNAARPLYAEWKNLLVWNKTNAGQGSFYRSKHELIAVFKNGLPFSRTAFKPISTILGLVGRGGIGQMCSTTRGSIACTRHAGATKCTALIADLIRDCSRRNGVILDPFGGSGTTMIAAERTGRISRLIELDPLYADLTIRRWQRITGIPVRHAQSQQSFAELAVRRGDQTNWPNPPATAPRNPARTKKG